MNGTKRLNERNKFSIFFYPSQPIRYYYLNAIISSIEISWHNTFILADLNIHFSTTHWSPTQFQTIFFSTTILNSSEEKSFSRLKLNIVFFLLLISNNLLERKQSLMEIYVRKTFMFTIHIHQPSIGIHYSSGQNWSMSKLNEWPFILDPDLCMVPNEPIRFNRTKLDNWPPSLIHPNCHQINGLIKFCYFCHQTLNWEVTNSPIKFQIGID